jgi:hypothetical protein
MSDELPVFGPTDLGDIQPTDWHHFAMKQLVPAIRINGPFYVQTRDGMLKCNDGWLALDVNGFPYPIDDEVFKKSYSLVD